jgi:hypothetical protein
MITRQRSSNVSWKPGRMSLEGHIFGLRYSGKFSGENSAVGFAHAREVST